MRSHVRKVVNAYAETLRHPSKSIGNRTLVPTKGPAATCHVARKNDVHRPTHADGPLELPLPAPDVSTMFDSRKLRVQLAPEERLLHEFMIATIVLFSMLIGYESKEVVPSTSR
jgi:hypothetical protein